MVVVSEKTKMALYSSSRVCLKWSNQVLIRKSQALKCFHEFYSSMKSEAGNKHDAPVNYFKTTASKVSAAENLKLVEEKQPDLWFRPYVLAGSILFFLAYFCIFREENDLDEILKGNSKYVSNEVKYVDLKLKLMFCEKNNLPTTALKAKIEEYEKLLGKT